MFVPLMIFVLVVIIILSQPKETPPDTTKPLSQIPKAAPAPRAVPAPRAAAASSSVPSTSSMNASAISGVATSTCHFDCSSIPGSSCVDGECTDPYLQFNRF